MIDDEDYIEGDENSERADTPEEIERYLAADRAKRRMMYLTHWLPIPGTEFLVSDHGLIGRWVGDDVVPDDSPIARAAADAFMERIRP